MRGTVAPRTSIKFFFRLGATDLQVIKLTADVVGGISCLQFLGLVNRTTSNKKNKLENIFTRHHNFLIVNYHDNA